MVEPNATFNKPYDFDDKLDDMKRRIALLNVKVMQSPPPAHSAQQKIVSQMMFNQGVDGVHHRGQ